MKKALIIILALCVLIGGGFLAYQIGLVDKLLSLFGLQIYRPLPSQNDPPREHVHSAVIDPAVPPTCHISGLTEGQHCSTCGQILVLQNVVPCLGHQYVNNICTVCGVDDHTAYLEFKLTDDDTYMAIVDENYPIHLIIPSTYMGKSVTAVTFLSISKMESVQIPDSVTAVLLIPVDSGSELPPVIKKENGVLYLDRWALFPTHETQSITLRPDTVGIANLLFGVWKITDIHIPKTVKHIPNELFRSISNEVVDDAIELIETTYNCLLNHITVEEGNPVYYSEGNCLIERETNTLLIGSNNGVIPQSVTGIADYAFAGCRKLTSITIPDGVTTISKGTFYDCRNLSSITFGENSNVTTIEASALYNCESLLTLTIPKSMERIMSLPAPYALTSITVEEGNKRYRSVGNCLIDTQDKTLILGCKNSVIPSDGSISKISSGAFRNCNGLTHITIPNGVTTIGNSAFQNCKNLKSVTISKSVTTIGDMAFADCTSLKTIIFEGTIEEWKAVKKLSSYGTMSCWNSKAPADKVICSDGTTKLLQPGRVEPE